SFQTWYNISNFSRQRPEHPLHMDDKLSIKDLKHAFYRALFIVFAIVAVFVIGQLADIDMTSYGVMPRKAGGLSGILTSPFVHGSWQLLIDNCAALLILLTLVLYFYKGNRAEIIAILYLLSGVWLWFIGRSTYHIG